MKVLVGAVIGIVGVVAVLAIVGMGIIYSGAYNVAATEDHASFTRWALDTTFHKAVERRASKVSAPPAFTKDMIQTGGAEYKAICQHCHGGPGIERAGWANNMRPRPPHLTEAAALWTPQEIFWIVKHGVKLSGMPALGPTHDDERLWNIVAFVKQLPAMTPKRYASIPNVEEGHRHDGSGGDHAAGHKQPTAEQSSASGKAAVEHGDGAGVDPSASSTTTESAAPGQSWRPTRRPAQ